MGHTVGSAQVVPPISVVLQLYRVSWFSMSENGSHRFVWTSHISQWCTMEEVGSDTAPGSEDGTRYWNTRSHSVWWLNWVSQWLTTHSGVVALNSTHLCHREVVARSHSVWWLNWVSQWLTTRSGVVALNSTHLCHREVVVSPHYYHCNWGLRGWRVLIASLPLRTGGEFMSCLCWCLLLLQTNSIWEKFPAKTSGRI